MRFYGIYYFIYFIYTNVNTQNSTENLNKYNHLVSLNIFLNKYENKLQNHSVDNKIPINSYKLNLYNEVYYNKILTKFEITAKFLYFIKSIDDYKHLYSIKEKENLNDDFILLIEDIELIRQIQSFFYIKQGSFKYVRRNITGYKSIIYNNLSGQLNIVNQDILRPILITDNDIFEEIKRNSDVIIESDNYNLKNFSKLEYRIIYDNTSSLLPIHYLNITCIVNLVLSSIGLILWIITSIQYRSHFTGIQKLLSLLLILKIIITWLIFFSFRLASEYNVSYDVENLFSKIYLETFITTLNSIYRTVFLFTIFLIAHGWKLLFTNIAQSEIKKFIIIYLIIYTAICFDQILDLAFNKFNHFFPSELKNIIFYTLFNFIIIKKTTIIFQHTKAKLMYAYQYFPEFVEGIRIKIRILRNFIICMYLYCIIFIFFHLFLKIYFFEFDENEILIGYVNFNNIDLIFFLLILGIFRTQNYPDTFYIQMATSENIFKNNISLKKVYKLKINKKDTTINKFLFMKSNIIPSIVLNPFHSGNEPMNEISIAFYSNK